MEFPTATTLPQLQAVPRCGPAGPFSLHVIVANPARVENPSNPKQWHTDSRNSLRREVAHRTSGELSIAETELKTRAIPLAGSSATKSQSPGFSL